MIRPYELIIPISQYQHLLSEEGYVFIDITEEVSRCVADSGIITGQVNIHTRHTTCGVAVQEYENGLVKHDFLNMFRSIAPVITDIDTGYLHNDLEVRKEQPDPKLDPSGDECLDAHAHMLKLLLPSNITSNIEGGEMLLGRWESILFVELNGLGRKERMASIHVSGEYFAFPKTTFTFKG